MMSFGRLTFRVTKLRARRPVFRFPPFKNLPLRLTPSVPVAPAQGLTFIPFEPIKPPSKSDFLTIRKDNDGGGGGGDGGTPHPEAIEKDSAGCMFSYVTALMKLVKKISDKADEQRESQRHMSSTEKRLMAEEWARDYEDAERELANCLTKGKSLQDAAGQEFRKHAQELVKDSFESRIKKLVLE